MIREGKELASLHPQIVVKVPCIKEGIKAIKYFSDNGIRTNCTLVFSVGQALLAAKAGATYVSPFVGRLDDISTDGVELIRQIVEVYNYYAMRQRYWLLQSGIQCTLYNVSKQGLMLPLALWMQFWVYSDILLLIPVSQNPRRF